MRFLGSILLSIAFPPVVLSADSTPLNCEQQLPHVRAICVDLEGQIVQQEARQRGRPVPSRAAIQLPAYGTEKAKEWGFACISGAAMRRLPNGWEQLRTRGHHHIRCKDI